MKQKRLLKRTTLLVIKKFLEYDQPLTTAKLVEATDISPREIAQIVKRLRQFGWLDGEVKSAPGAELRRGRYRLTATGRRDAPRAMDKQATWTKAEGWVIPEGESLPAPRRRPPVNPFVQRFIRLRSSHRVSEGCH